jgi:hypothetical protein
MKTILSLIAGFFSKFKYYLYGLIALILIAGFFTIKYLVKENQRYRSDNYRLESNQFQILSDATQQTELYLKQKEVTGRIKRERDSLALIVKVKPKFITKVITIDNSTHDTTKVPVPVNIIDKNVWMLRDSGACFKYASKLILEGSEIKGERQLFEYNNKTVQTFYKQRPHKFLGIRFGKWQYKQRIEAQCGETKIETISFLK